MPVGAELLERRMKQQIIRKVVRMKLAFQSVARANKTAEGMKAYYLSLAEGMGEEQGRRVVVVPQSMGVDAEMTHWSYYQLMEHNAIVNRTMTRVVTALMTGEGVEALDQFDPKHDVLPSHEAGSEVIEEFRSSVDDHLLAVQQFGKLKSTLRRNHPIFGSFNAHMWHGMFGLHLKVHQNQAKTIANQAKG